MRKIISIIIPVYNIQAEYLTKCIQSILDQERELTEIEILIINDGTTLPECLMVLKEFGRIDGVQIYSQVNKGVSAARNLGIEKAQGEYLLFLDSDDFITENCLRDVLEFLKYNVFDIMCFKHIMYRKKYDNKLQNINTNNAIKEAINKNHLRAIVLCQNYEGYNLGTVWSKIFRREYVMQNQLKYKNDLPRSQDRVFMLEAMLKAEEIIFWNYYGYVQRLNSHSVCAQCNKDLWNKLERVYDAYLEELKNTKLVDKKEREIWLESAMVNHFFQTTRGEIFHKDNIILFREKCRKSDYILDNMLDLKVSKKLYYLPLKRKILYKMLQNKSRYIVYILFDLQSKK